jgi:hypothetical protein
VLDLGELAYAGVPCWTGRAERWAHFTVPGAYAARYDTQVRPVMPGNPVSLKALVRVAAARARYVSADQKRAVDNIAAAPWLLCPLAAPVGAGKTTSMLQIPRRRHPAIRPTERGGR